MKFDREVEERYLQVMGDELGGVFHRLYSRLVELHIIWQQYQQLFGANEETLHLLNRTSGLFFKVVQNELWDSVLLGVSRLTDPASTGNKKNLTIQSLPPLLLDPTLRVELEVLIDQAITAATFAREHRNKRIAHQDHDYASDRDAYPLSGISRQKVEEMLEAIRNVLNRLDQHFRDTTVIYEDFIDVDGARVLVMKLRKFEELRDEEMRGKSGIHLSAL